MIIYQKSNLAPALAALSVLSSVMLILDNLIETISFSIAVLKAIWQLQRGKPIVSSYPSQTLFIVLLDISRPNQSKPFLKSASRQLARVPGAFKLSNIWLQNMKSRNSLKVILQLPPKDRNCRHSFNPALSARVKGTGRLVFIRPSLSSRSIRKPLQSVSKLQNAHISFTAFSSWGKYTFYCFFTSRILKNSSIFFLGSTPGFFLPF